MTAEDWKRKSVCKVERPKSEVELYCPKKESSRITTTHLEVLGNLTHEALEGELADEELR